MIKHLGENRLDQLSWLNVGWNCSYKRAMVSQIISCRLTIDGNHYSEAKYRAHPSISNPLDVLQQSRILMLHFLFPLLISLVLKITKV